MPITRTTIRGRIQQDAQKQSIVPFSLSVWGPRKSHCLAITALSVLSLSIYSCFLWRRLLWFPGKKAQVFPSIFIYIHTNIQTFIRPYTNTTSYFFLSMVSSNQECHWLLSAVAGIVMCKIVYDLTGVVSLLFFKGYAKLNDAEKIEWKSRGFSTFHALVVAIASLYLFLFSNLFDEDSHKELIINRRSTLSDTILGISIGYFLSDSVMMFWHFPALGGMEFKNSKLYICNGAALFVGWLVGRILLFTFFFYHVIAHFDQKVKDVFLLGFYSLIAVPPVLAMMNLFWFWKIARGMMKTLSKAGYCKQSPPYGPVNL
ncbi:unnamed protein product [Camellia sinensis]